jgi:hypothetical protein
MAYQAYRLSKKQRKVYQQGASWTRIFFRFPLPNRSQRPNWTLVELLPVHGWKALHYKNLEIKFKSDCYWQGGFNWLSSSPSVPCCETSQCSTEMGLLQYRVLLDHRVSIQVGQQAFLMWSFHEISLSNNKQTKQNYEIEKTGRENMM